MDSQTIYNTIRETVKSNMPGARDLLFGSRARGDHDRFSDYDLLIITPETLPDRKKIKLNTLLNHAIVNALRIPVDILINSKEKISEKQELPGHRADSYRRGSHIVRWARETCRLDIRSLFMDRIIFPNIFSNSTCL